MVYVAIMPSPAHIQMRFFGNKAGSGGGGGGGSGTRYIDGNLKLVQRNKGGVVIS